MANESLTSLTSATAATGGNLYGVQSGNSRKFTLTAAGATLVEASDAAAQRTALGVGVTSVTYGATITTDASTVAQDDVLSVTLTGALTLGAPTSPTNGQRFSYHLTASGATRTVTLNASIKTPTGVTFDGAIPSGSTRVLELTYLASRWLVTRNLEAVA